MAGQYARVLVDQRTINVALTVFGPESDQLFSSDSYSIGERESAELIGKVSGNYRLRVTPSEPNAPGGQYTISLKDVELATDRHRMRVAGAEEFAHGIEYYLQGTREGMLKAVDYLSRALAHLEAAQDRAAEARVLFTIALLYAEAGNQPKAADYAERALPVAQDSRDRLVEARALDALGQVHFYFGDKRKAIDYYERALRLMRSAGDQAGVGTTLSNMAVAYSRTGSKRKAIEQLSEAMAIFQGLQDRKMSSDVASNLGVTYDDLGEYQKALESHQRSLALKRELGLRASQAISLNNIGSARSGLAEYQKALDAYTAALEINRLMENQRNIAINLNNIAWVYGQLADYRHALSFYQESLAIVRELSDRQMIAVTLNNIAEIHADLGDYRKAVRLHQEALPLRRLTGDADGEANSLNNLGKAYLKIGDRANARNHFEQALAKLRALGNRHMMARTLRNLGELDCETGDYRRAQEYLDEALQISLAIRDRNGEALALVDLARLERDRGNLREAHRRADEALTALESVRLAVASPKLRASFFASVRDVQELEIEVLMRLNAEESGKGYGAAALLASERGRARSLLEMLGEGAVDIRQGVDSALLDRERELEQLISAKSGRLTRLLAGIHTEIEVQTTERELDALTLEHEQVQSKIRVNSPQYASLTQPALLSLNEIQTKVLDPATVLLEYAFTKNKSFLWAVTHSSVDIFELPPRAEIESAVKRVYDLLTARNQKVPKETPSARAERIRQADAAYPTAAAKVSQLLLGPAASRIDNKRLLIVGEGALLYVPFAALPEPGDEDRKRVPLMVKHEIISVPSASVLAVLRREALGRKLGEMAVAILADPVFSADDARIVREKDQAQSIALQSGGGLGGQGFVRLRFSRREADEIARLAPAEGTLKALDFDASRDTVLNQLSHYRIVHFATHGLLDNQHPELSGVVLSLFDRSGHPQNGFLRLYDIYNLRLGADLVVLSACETALGGEIKGEGLIGLTRGFLYAGTARVVASLWKVDDRTSAELMTRFYDAMLRGGQSAAAALRAAQIAVWSTKGWGAPYYWSAFTLQGEWR